MTDCSSSSSNCCVAWQEGSGTEADRGRARSLFREAAEKGNHRGMWGERMLDRWMRGRENVGSMDQRGEGILDRWTRGERESWIDGCGEEALPALLLRCWREAEGGGCAAAELMAGGGGS